MLKKNNEALLTYVEDLKNLRNIILNDIGAGGTGGQQPSETVTGQAANKENILKKALKCKQLEDDNKKLRKLLKTQIENSEQLRQDTQNTIETLREEFDILVKELLQYKQKDGKAGGGSSQTGVTVGGGMKPKTNSKGVPGLALPGKGGSDQPMGLSNLSGQNFNKAKGTKAKK